MSTQMICRTVNEIPLYLEGASDDESVLRFQEDPIGFHLRAFRQLGPIYATYFRKRTWVVLAGLEANDFVWRNWKIWDYSEANAPFLDEMGTDHVTALDGEHHRDKRTILKPAFDQAPAMRFLPQFHRLLGDELTKACNQRIELTKFWAKVITKINSQTVARAEIPDDVIERMPEWLRALREELDSWNGSDLRALAQMPRLKASILETQRIRPGIFALGKHAGEDFEFEGYRVPAGTDVLHVNTLGHFLEEVYEEPFRFKPERFLEQDKFAPKTFGLFGGGPHVCLGRNHSLMQTPVAVAQAIRNYNVVFEEPPEKWGRVGYAGSRVHQDLWARLRPRRWRAAVADWGEKAY